MGRKHGHRPERNEFETSNRKVIVTWARTLAHRAPRLAVGPRLDDRLDASTLPVSDEVNVGVHEALERVNPVEYGLDLELHDPERYGGRRALSRSARGAETWAVVRPGTPTMALRALRWSRDLIEREQRGSASEVCADIMIDRATWSEVIRRLAMLARMVALPLEGASSVPASSIVRLIERLAQTELYMTIAPREALFRTQRKRRRAPLRFLRHVAVTEETQALASL